MKCLFTLVVAFFALSIAVAGDLKPKAVPAVAPEIESSLPYVKKAPTPPPPSMSVTNTLTGLAGYYDWQSNGGCAQQVVVNPANGNIHVIYTLSDDSADIGNSRSIGYAFSTDGGATWDNFNNVRIPGTTSSGYANLDIARGGAIAGSPVLALHTNPGGGTQIVTYADVPEGTGTFIELGGVPALTPLPIWPKIAGGTDGSLTLHGSPNSTAPETNWLTRTPDLTAWTPWIQYPGFNDIGGRYPTHSDGAGKIGSLLQAVNEGTFWLESTDNGATWPSTADTIHMPAGVGGRVAGVDTFQAWVGADFVYDGSNPLVVVDELGIGANDPTDAGYIAFWSQSNGWTEIARPSTTPGAIELRNLAQSNHFTMGWPTIGLSGSTIVVAFAAMQAEFSAAGFNYMDIFMVKSDDGGATWTPPNNLTNTPNQDERYPSLSKWNEPGFANIVWQEDTQPGSHAFTDNAPKSLSWQVFNKVDLTTLTGVGGGEPIAREFSLDQNYPNPFNPSTKIRFSVSTSGPVELRVHNVLGQEVATLADGYRNAGEYEVSFSAQNLTSGVYFYTLRSGDFVSTKKMLLMK